MIKINHKEDCCGCTACAMICPKDAIQMKPDKFGFLYPVVDLGKCVDCGLCEKVCAFNKHYDTTNNLPTPDVYAVRHKDMAEIETSRSGAMFIAISDYVLDNNGVVYGVGYADHFRVVHKRASNKEERNEFKGSKYVQSDMDTIFRQVKNDLRNGRMVLFSGTPCQTSGLQSFLKLSKINTTLLIVCDIVCHGVPSPYIWRDYLAYIEKKAKKKVLSVNFRDKSELGWAAHKESFAFDNYKTYANTYTNTFYQHVMLRQSCGVCHFTNLQRPGDITLADFWGWEKTDEIFNADNKGVSLVLINTPKGQKVFRAIKDDVNYIESNTKDCLQPNLLHPTEIHPGRDEFEKDYIDKGFLYVMKKYGDLGFKAQLNYKKSDLKKKIKSLVKK